MRIAVGGNRRSAHNRAWHALCSIAFVNGVKSLGQYRISSDALHDCAECGRILEQARTALTRARSLIEHLDRFDEEQSRSEDMGAISDTPYSKSLDR